MSNVNAVLTGFSPEDTRGWVMVVVVWTLVPLALSTVVLRIYCRYALSKNMGIDDCMACWSMILVIITGCVQTLMTRHGLGTHKEFLDDEQRRYYNKLFYVSIVFYISALYSIKMHVLLQYLRLFSIKMRRLTIWVLWGVGLYGIASVMISIFKCNPIPGFWDPRLGALCIPTMPNWYLNSIGNIVTDVLVFALPLRVLWNLKLNRATRLSLVAVFGLGFITVGLSLLRISLLDILKGDETYQNVVAGSCSIAELCCGMIVSCAPCLRPLLKRFIPALRGGSTDTASGGNKYLRTLGGGHYCFTDLEAAKSSNKSGSRGSKMLAGVAHSNSGKGATNIDAVKMTHHRTNSTTELTDNKEFSFLEESIHSPTPKTDKDQRRESCDSGSGTDGAILPIQGTTLHSSRYTTLRGSSRDDVSSPRNAESDEQFLGLRLGTCTTINAGGSSSPAHPPSAVLVETGGGIRVKREFVQRSVPS